MRETKKKVERVQPIMRVRKAQLDQEAAALAEIRRSKIEALEELKKYQSMYIDGVEKLNQMRQTGDMGRLPAMESSLDFVKSQWYQSLKKVKGIEDQEKAQLENLLNAQKNLKSIETLKERLTFELMGIEKQLEQKAMDEVAVQRFGRKVIE